MLRLSIYVVIKIHSPCLYRRIALALKIGTSLWSYLDWIMLSLFELNEHQFTISKGSFHP